MRAARISILFFALLHYSIARSAPEQITEYDQTEDTVTAQLEAVTMTITRSDYCLEDNDCPKLLGCVANCPNGMNNRCVSVKCINNQCVSFPPCAQKTCQNSSDCPMTLIQCVGCLDLRGPRCLTATCEAGYCKMIQPCSQENDYEILGAPDNFQRCNVVDDCPPFVGSVRECQDPSKYSSTRRFCINHKCAIIPLCTRPKCNEDSDCPVNSTNCKSCGALSGPSCEKTKCDNGLCVRTRPCTLQIEEPEGTCSNDADCPATLGCVAECTNGLTNRCVSVKCIKNKCVRFPACVPQACESSSDCPSNPNNCATCSEHAGPHCEQATCENGFCRLIEPCSQNATVGEPVTQLPVGTCSVDTDCPLLAGCVLECQNGMNNPCVKVTCVENKCVAVPPCTQRTCEWSSDCPVSSDEEKTCAPGYGPNREESCCENGLCKWTKACSKKLEECEHADN